MFRVYLVLTSVFRLGLGLLSFRAFWLFLFLFLFVRCPTLPYPAAPRSGCHGGAGRHGDGRRSGRRGGARRGRRQSCRPERELRCLHDGFLSYCVSL